VIINTENEFRFIQQIHYIISFIEERKKMGERNSGSKSSRWCLQGMTALVTGGSRGIG